MAIHTDDAIILRRKDVRETSILLTLYTPSSGKIMGLIKGVRGDRGFLAGHMQVFTLNRIVFYDTKRSAVHTVSQCDLLDFFEAVRLDIVKTGYACYFIELVDALTADSDKTSSAEIFSLLLKSLESLKTEASPKRLSRILEIKLLSITGLMPRLDKCVLCSKAVDFKQASGAGKARFSYKSGGLICGDCCPQDTSSARILPGTVHFIGHVERVPYEKAARIKVSKDVGKELEETMKRFMDYHVNAQLKSMGFLKAIE